MLLTKYQHACFTLEADGKLLVVDPGVFTTNLPSLQNVVAVIITHVHPDHFDPDILEALFASNPDMVVYGPQQVDKEISGEYEHVAVKPGDHINAGPFAVECFGGLHVRVHQTITPQFENLGIMINDTLYYPGDSFTLPEGRPIPWLALPVSGPWLRIGEVMDFVLAAKADRAFYTHDALWSEKSQSFEKDYIGLAAQQAGTRITEANDSLELDG